MYDRGTKGLAAALICALMLPCVGLAEDEDRIAALEARVTALEEKLDALLAKPTPEPEPEAEQFAIGETLFAPDGESITVSSYETGTKFRYSPAGGISTLSLSAKPGYLLLCLYVTVENKTGSDVYTTQLLDSVLHYGYNYTNKAQDSFFYRTRSGVFAGGLKVVGPNSTVEGCLLFAVPESVDSSNDAISVRFLYDDRVYECQLRPDATF